MCFFCIAVLLTEPLVWIKVFFSFFFSFLQSDMNESWLGQDVVHVQPYGNTHSYIL